MRSAAHIAGHPIHPMLVGFPIAYLVGSTLLNLWARASGQHRLHQTARDMNALGLAAACAAAIPGIVDYVNAVPPQSSAKERATRHALTNVSALALFTLARIGATSGRRPAAWTSAAEVAGAAAMTAGGWLGGTLVYRNQIGVDHRFADAGKWIVEDLQAESGDAEVDAGPEGELGVDQMKLLRVGGQRIVLARTEQGYAAFADRCTHKGGPLSDGALVCGTVQCPWHGSQFDGRTGAVKAGPAGQPIETYAVAVRAGRVLVSRR